MSTDRFPSLLKLAASGLVVVVCAVGAAAPPQIPAGTELQIRLKSKVSTSSSKVKEVVEAQVIAPVLVEGEFLIPAGAAVRGAVATVKPSTKPEERAVLGITFNEIELGGRKLKLGARLAGIDNAREKVDEQGQIQGILASETISARLDQGIEKVAERFAGLADILGAAKGTVLKPTDTGIAYDAGVDMDLVLTAALTVDKAYGPGPAAQLEPLDDNELVQLAESEPFQTTAQKPPKPSDVTNLMLAGTQEQVEAAFKAAGWSTAAALNAQSKLETFRAIAEQRGYHEAPVSILLLDGQPPDLVFQKQNNTFASRHHLRVWRRPSTYRGAPVWVVAATHDTGIEFSQANRTFIHKIDSKIDRERAKVVNDLVFGGGVRGLALAERPAVPQKSQNATGDALETDGRIAVLLLR